MVYITDTFNCQILTSLNFLARMSRTPCAKTVLRKLSPLHSAFKNSHLGVIYLLILI